MVSSWLQILVIRCGFKRKASFLTVADINTCFDRVRPIKILALQDKDVMRHSSSFLNQRKNH